MSRLYLKEKGYLVSSDGYSHMFRFAKMCQVSAPLAVSLGTGDETFGDQVIV